VRVVAWAVSLAALTVALSDDSKVGSLADLWAVLRVASWVAWLAACWAASRVAPKVDQWDGSRVAAWDGAMVDLLVDLMDALLLA